MTTKPGSRMPPRGRRPARRFPSAARALAPHADSLLVVFDEERAETGREPRFCVAEVDDAGLVAHFPLDGDVARLCALFGVSEAAVPRSPGAIFYRAPGSRAGSFVSLRGVLSAAARGLGA
jgi:hypothetical protein